MTAHDLTEDQIALLRNLLALQEAGLIGPASAYVTNGYDDGTLEAVLPEFVTYEGRKFLEQQEERREAAFPPNRKEDQ